MGGLRQDMPEIRKRETAALDPHFLISTIHTQQGFFMHHISSTNECAALLVFTQALEDFLLRPDINDRDLENFRRSP
jgi:hypothetical protein